jgi:predicted aminopeptidase
MRLYHLPLALCVTWATSAFAGVWVSAPTNNSNVATTVQYLATATTELFQRSRGDGHLYRTGQAGVSRKRRKNKCTSHV